MFYPMYFDPTYVLVLIGVIISAIASYRVNSAYSKYSRVANHAGITGAMAAERILRAYENLVLRPILRMKSDLFYQSYLP